MFFSDFFVDCFMSYFVGSGDWFMSYFVGSGGHWAFSFLLNIQTGLMTTVPILWRLYSVAPFPWCILTSNVNCQAGVGCLRFFPPLTSP